MLFKHPFMNVAESLRALQRSPSYRGQLLHLEHLSPGQGYYGRLSQMAPLFAEAIRGFGSVAPLLSPGTDYKHPT